MNLCFLIGKIISDVKFDFILNSKNISIARFKIELENKSIIKVKAYNELADYCYKHLVKNDIVSIYAMLDSKGEMQIIEIDLI